MKIECFSVYDSAAGAFLEPFFSRTPETAIRAFRATVNSGQNDISSFPEDYTLFHIGTFDQETAEFSTFTPHSLGVAIMFLDSGVSDAPE